MGAWTESVWGRSSRGGTASRSVCARPRSSDFWRAVDTTLDRTVGVRLVSPATAEDAMDAARRAAMVDEPALLRVLDVAQEDGDTGPVTYVVTEFVEADSLADLLRRDGPLPADRVRALVGETAQVLSRVAASGLHHEALEPTSVLRTPGGELKIEGLGVDAAAEGRAGAPGEQAARTDAVALVALVYAGLTGHWPLGRRGRRPRAGAADRWHAGTARRRRQRRAERPRHPLRGDLRPRRRRSADARGGRREPAAVDRGRGGRGGGRRARRRAGHRGAARGRRPAPRPWRAPIAHRSADPTTAPRAPGRRARRRRDAAGRPVPSRGPGAGTAAAGAAGRRRGAAACRRGRQGGAAAPVPPAGDAEHTAAISRADLFGDDDAGPHRRRRGRPARARRGGARPARRRPRGRPGRRRRLGRRRGGTTRRTGPTRDGRSDDGYADEDDDDEAFGGYEEDRAGPDRRPMIALAVLAVLVVVGLVLALQAIGGIGGGDDVTTEPTGGTTGTSSAAPLDLRHRRRPRRARPADLRRPHPRPAGR